MDYIGVYAPRLKHIRILLDISFKMYFHITWNYMDPYVSKSLNKYACMFWFESMCSHVKYMQ